MSEFTENSALFLKLRQMGVVNISGGRTITEPIWYMRNPKNPTSREMRKAMRWLNKRARGN